MNLLITNDDGICAKGIFALAKELEKEHQVVVVAPDNQRSACGHSITLNRPLSVKKVNLEGLKSKAFSVDGTPADCVRIGIEICRGNVDMVVSGINNGFNIGIDILYSGTVSAAIEAAINKIPSIAVSTDLTENLKDYSVPAKYASIIMEKAKGYLKENSILNVNVPLISESEITGIKVCKMGNKIYDNSFFPDTRNEKEFNVGIQGSLNTYFERCTDKYFIKNKYVTVTPIQYDLTDYKVIQEVSNIFK